MRVGILKVYRICSTHAPIHIIPLVLSPVCVYILATDSTCSLYEHKNSLDGADVYLCNVIP